MVRKGGFEPPRLSAPPPQDGVSASSTTSAYKTARKPHEGTEVCPKSLYTVEPERSRSAALCLRALVDPAALGSRPKTIVARRLRGVRDVFIVGCVHQPSLNAWNGLRFFVFCQDDGAATVVGSDDGARDERCAAGTDSKTTRNGSCCR